jgi:hypothetical protein
MARPQVADGGEGLQIWRVAANILNNQSQAADKGWTSRLGLGVGLLTPHRKESNVLRNVSKCLGPELILCLRIGSRVGFYDHGYEPSVSVNKSGYFTSIMLLEVFLR